MRNAFEHSLHLYFDVLESDLGSLLQRLVQLRQALEQGSSRQDRDRKALTTMMVRALVQRHLRRTAHEENPLGQDAGDLETVLQIAGIYFAGQEPEEQDTHGSQDYNPYLPYAQPQHRDVAEADALDRVLGSWPKLDLTMGKWRPQAFSEGIHLLSLGQGIGADVRALLINGVKIAKLTSCEIDPTARSILRAHLVNLHREFPRQLPREVIANMNAVVPYDASRITRKQLKLLGHVDLVCCGFPCMSVSAAGRQDGFADPRMALFMSMCWILLQIQIIQGATVGWLLECTPPDVSTRPRAKAFWKTALDFLGPYMVCDAAAMNGYSRRRRAWWTNLVDVGHLQEAADALVRDPALKVDDILGPGRRAQVCTQGNRPSYYPANELGLPLRVLPTLVSFPFSYMFRLGREGMVIQTTAQGTENYAPLSVTEREQAMGFPPTAGGAATETDRASALGKAWHVTQAQWIFMMVLETQNTS